MSDAIPNLADVLKRFDDSSDPLDEHDIEAALYQLRKQEMDAGLGDPPESVAEVAAFMFCANYQWRGDGWGSYYGPMFAFTAADGTTVFTPNIKRFNLQTFAYWDRRAREAKHPVLRIRYADLCWEFQKQITRKGPPIEMAQIVIDSTLEAATRRMFRHDVIGRDRLARALSIALSINDEPRVAAVRDGIVAYERAVARDDAPGLWGFSFDLLLGNPKIAVSAEVEQQIIQNLEDRLASLCADGPGLDPFAAESAALRLATYYRRKKRTADVKRVLTAWGDLFLRLSAEAKAMLASSWLRRVHDQYAQFGLRNDAQAVLVRLQEVSKKVNAELVEYRDSVKISPEEWKKYLDQMTAGELSACLNRIAVQFVPNRDKIIEQIQEMASSAPLTSMMSLSHIDHEGRQTALIGSVDDDLEGRIVHHMGQNMQFSATFLAGVIDAARDKFGITTDSLIDHLYQSPVFNPEQRSLFTYGIEKYLASDYVAAIHVMIPQIESALRHLVSLAGGAIWKPHPRSGLMMVRTLDDLLRDDRLIAILTSARVEYLRVLLTDPRGWNLRNDVCHGLCQFDVLGRVMADRLLHVLLLLAPLRRREPTAVDRSRGT